MEQRTVLIGNGNTIIIAAATEDTAGAFALLDYELAPGFASLPLHIHTAEDEAIYVLEGWLLVRLGEHEHLLGTGQFVFLPKGVAHGQSNPVQEPVRFLLLVFPAGFEQCFHDLDVLLKTGAPCTLARISPLLAGYGARIVEDIAIAFSTQRCNDA